MKAELQSLFIRGARRSTVEKMKARARAENTKLAEVLDAAISHLGASKVRYGRYLGSDPLRTDRWESPLGIAIVEDTLTRDSLSGTYCIVRKELFTPVQPSELRSTPLGRDFLSGKPAYISFSGRIIWKVVDLLPSIGCVRVILERYHDDAQVNASLVEEAAELGISLGLDPSPEGTSERLVREDRARNE